MLRLYYDMRLFSFDVDDLGLDLFCFRQGDGQDTVFELSLRLVRDHLGRQGNCTFEGAPALLAHVPGLVLFLIHLPGLAFEVSTSPVMLICTSSALTPGREAFTTITSSVWYMSIAGADQPSLRVSGRVNASSNR